MPLAPEVVNDNPLPATKTAATTTLMSTEDGAVVVPQSVKASAEEVVPTTVPEQVVGKDVSEAGASFTQELVLTPSVKASVAGEAPGLSQKVKVFESPLEELPPLSNIVNLNHQLMVDVWVSPQYCI